MNGVMTHPFTKFAQTLGVKGAHWHALRHSNITIALGERADLATRKDPLGHASNDVNLTYSHAGDKAQFAASDAIEKRSEAEPEEVRQRLSVIETVTQTVTQQPAVSATYCKPTVGL